VPLPYCDEKNYDVSPVPFAITDVVPLYRRGLAAALSQAGFTSEDPPDIEEWLQGGGPHIVLHTVNLQEDLKLIARYTGFSADDLVIALLREPTADMYVAAVQAGASGAVSWMATPEEVVRVVHAARARHWVLPAAVAKAMIERVMPAPEATGLTSAEREWSGTRNERCSECSTTSTAASGCEPGQKRSSGRRSGVF
jgi:DNA-binding NarL/FixJ family response regulator